MNEELMRTVVGNIEADLKSWDQRWYGHATPCGTTYCVAGHTLLASGWTYEQSRMSAEDDGNRMAWYDPAGNEPEDFGPDETARVLLGLTRSEAQGIFLHVRPPWEEPLTIEDLKEHITEVTGMRW